MKRILALAVVMGLFYITMASFTSAQQNAKESKSDNYASTKTSARQVQDDPDYDRDDLKTGLTRAFYDALMGAENDINNINNQEGNDDQETIIGPDGKERSIFGEARRTIFEADQILARIKAENKKALVKLRNPPRRIYPVQKQLPKVEEAKDQQTIKQQIETQEKLIEKQQQKLETLKKELVTAPAE
tara:strand:- start:40457 stop:41020 length:564 start_codon:yes stop_codon:yes gene_type:complete